MPKKTVPLECSAEALELGVGLANTVLELKPALEDGVDWGDIPEAVSAVTSHLIPALDGVDQMVDEYKEDPDAFMAAWMYAGLHLWNGLQQQVEEPEPPEAA